MRHLLVGLGLRAFATLIAAFGLLTLELSAYFALVQIWSAIAAAAILGTVNFAQRPLSSRSPTVLRQGVTSSSPTKFTAPQSKPFSSKPRTLQAQVSGA